ncbi:uncharacterized protein LOC127102871 [Lathyrus oleraceus]|uniref:uncharacterized protein LOC127102871 n=1 Tax=Pisum sativum TaxID=3888 RepID=UPI0021D1326F|nr:uncharacterized protein LOC127102871 [Pisum sativum]
MGRGFNDYKFFSEALDKHLKDMSEIPQTSKKLFGGIVVFCGDFRQILSVVPRDSTSDIIHATVNASYIWDQCRVLGLTTNTHLKNGAISKHPIEAIVESIYPDLIYNYLDLNYLQSRAILDSTIETVDDINQFTSQIFFQTR